ncbi:PIN domain-containing protein [Peribacillus sp. NPDC097206]|uniref:PIN domain-containing protein n=1 Tax=unclassified Peribacillus TaxID=2675266 RepID=UPI003826CB4D
MTVKPRSRNGFDLDRLIASLDKIKPIGTYAFVLLASFIIPSVVFQELDSKKKLMDELGKKARYVSKQLDKLRQQGKLHEGVQLSNGGKLTAIYGHMKDTVVTPGQKPEWEENLENASDNVLDKIRLIDIYL